MVSTKLCIFLFTLLGTLSMVFPAMLRLRRSEALGISVLFIGAFALPRENVIAYTVAAVSSTFFYYSLTGKEKLGRERLIKLAVCFSAGMALTFAGSFFSGLAIYMRSGGMLAAILLSVIIYITMNRGRRAETAAGIFSGMSIFFVTAGIEGLASTSFTGERGLMIALVSLLILPKIYVGRLWDEQELKPSAGIFIALPILFFSSVPVNFSTSAVLAAFNNSSIVTGGYISIAEEPFQSAFTWSMFFSILLIVSVLYSAKYLKRYKISVPVTAVRFGRPFMVALSLAMLIMHGAAWQEISAAAIMSFFGFVLYKSFITPEAVFMGYSICAVIREESIKTGMAAAETGYIHYFMNLPFQGIAAITIIAIAAYITNGWGRDRK
ncbi:hypothetical protein [Seleniivibrio sp.]|uniref:hypothetical protein n=1 Tax=Seleniivibrio sp. TaxID=2898801 RepID=UPI00260070DF|nr:hypothetical protein [Seleniivibrio sp.]MCD8554397.1 hypothetical protein [Seleniivibrio sp.]